eukprot:scaffold80778_cov16-Tisochrysis_lutea.AAC.2
MELHVQMVTASALRNERDTLPQQAPAIAYAQEGMSEAPSTETREAGMSGAPSCSRLLLACTGTEEVDCKLHNARKNTPCPEQAPAGEHKQMENTDPDSRDPDFEN